eukprot:155290_1
MSSDESDNDLLKFANNNYEDRPKESHPRSVCHYVYKCAVIGLLLAILFVILAGFIWFYLSVDVSTMGNVALGRISRPSASTSTTAIESVTRLYDFGIAASMLPNDTVRIIYDHDMDSDGVTKNESSILRQIFDLFDDDADGAWSSQEYKTFIYFALEPQTNFDVIDMDSNGVISLKEIYLFLKSFDTTDIYDCDETDSLLVHVFGYNAENDVDRKLYNEYVAHLWLYQLDQEKIGVISKMDYVSYIEQEEWDFHNKNDDAFVDFDEFKSVFFDSIYYKSWKHSMQILAKDNDLIQAIYQRIGAITSSDIESLQLLTSPHDFDSDIKSYVDTQKKKKKNKKKNSNSNSDHGATQSLLYSFPNIYYARDLIDMTSRRRLQITYACDQATPCPETSLDFIWYCDKDGECVYGNPCRLKSQNGIPCTRETPCPISYRNDLDLNCNQTNCDTHDTTLPGRPPTICMKKPMDSTAAYNMHLMIKTGAGCFGEAGHVDMIADGNYYNKQLKDVTVGEYVFDGQQYTKIIAVERGDEYMVMMELFMHVEDKKENTSIVLTEDHLLYNKKHALIRADEVQVGGVIYNEYVVYQIEYHVVSKPSTPITMSGMIQVNGIKSSCYIIGEREADIEHRILAPFRWASTYMSEYYASLVIEACIHDVLQIYVLLIKPYGLFIVFDLIEWNLFCKAFFIALGLLVFAIKYVLLFVAAATIL